jgi:hypothetical protein
MYIQRTQEQVSAGLLFSFFHSLVAIELILCEVRDFQCSHLLALNLISVHDVFDGNAATKFGAKGASQHTTRYWYFLLARNRGLNR